MNLLFINVNERARVASSDAIPLSMGYILAYLRSLGHEGVIVDDLYDRPLSLHALEKWIKKLNPEIVGFSAYQANMERIRFFSLYTKSRHPNICVLLGGPQAISMPSSALLDLENVDIISRGEGEIVTSAIAECIEKSGPLSSVNDITFRDGNDIIDTELGPDLPDDLDQFPSPYLNDIIDLQGKRSAMISTARGCKYNCLFCVTPSASGRRVRCHSVKRTLNEMEYLADKGTNHFWFRDENFGGTKERALEILQGKIERGIETPFWCEIRSDWIDDEIIETLREAGAETIAFGLESANAEVLSKTGKGIALERLSRTIQFVKSAGMNVGLFSIYGLPGETVEKARQTLHFVQDCKVPIRESSGGQQMQLYFGSTYQEHCEQYGFRPTAYYLPAYLSVGDRYETETLTSGDIRRIASMWSIALDRFGQSVHNMQQPLDILNFLIFFEEDLRDEEAFYEYGAIASSALEEQELLWRFLEGYVGRLNPSESRLTQLMSKLKIFKETPLAAGSTSRVIFDCRSDTDSVSSLRMTGRYQDVVLGQNSLPPWFEKHLVGLRQAQRVRFGFTFPREFAKAELQNRTVRFWVKIHKVLNSVDVTSVKQLKSLNIRNHYVFPTLDGLQENEILHHLVLRDIPEHDLVKMPLHFLMYMYNCARLHKMEYVKRAAALLTGEGRALNALAEILHSAGRYREAAHYYGESGSNDPDTLIKKARSLFLGGEVQKAVDILNSMAEKTSLSFKGLLLECLKALEPRSEQIPRLDRDILRLKVDAASQKAILEQTEGSIIRPITHGDETLRRNSGL